MDFYHNSLLKIFCSMIVLVASHVAVTPPVNATKQELLPLKGWDEKVIRWTTAYFPKIKVRTFLSERELN
jgi:hypothetical protein